MANRSKNVDTVTDFLFLGSKITADDACNREIRRRLLLGRISMTNLDSVLKSKDITLPTKVHILKAMAFPVVMSVVMVQSELDHKEDKSAKELMLSNCGAEEDYRESLGQQGDQTHPS